MLSYGLMRVGNCKACLGKTFLELRKPKACVNMETEYPMPPTAKFKVEVYNFIP
jgi:hypothetical protein